MNTEINSESELPSKTQLKQEATELQELGRKLTSYSPEVLSKFPLTEVLLAEIEEFKRLPNSFGAQRRQLQFIGKLMRDVDYDAVVTAIANLENTQLKKKKKPSASAALCAKILDGGDDEINAALQLHPQLERQKLRQFYREFHRADETVRDRFRSKLQNYLQQQIDS